MKSTAKWPWSRSLALVPIGSPVQVKEILFGAVQDQCSDLGIRQGAILTPKIHHDDGVEVTLPSGTTIRLPRHYAWFVSVDPV